MSITTEDVVPTLIVRLDTTVLRTMGGSLCNAVRTDHEDRAVTGVHDFLLLQLVAATGRCTATPLFTSPAVGNQPLDPAKKSGGNAAWRDGTHFFSHWQHWQIPVEAIVSASVEDAESPASRRRYSVEDPTEIDAIRKWERRNRASYRALTTIPELP